MILYRITRQIHAVDLSGAGGLVSSARWHDHLPIIYTSVNSSTCILEKLVNMNPDEIHHDMVFSIIEVDESLGSEVITADQLPGNWKTYPAPDVLKRVGNAWLKGKTSAMLFVPSVIDPFAQNVLINPLHSGVSNIKVKNITPFTFDGRFKY
jgi:RES domain-containing protein